jgi:signal transduction histidine kinase
MINELRDKYLTSKTQIVILDKSSKIIASENILFNLEIGTQIEDFHPFFYVLSDILITDDIETVFSGVHIEYNGEQKVIDIVVNSGNTKENPILIFIDFTYYYKNFQSVAQEKNESVLNFHLEELKNQQLESEKKFKDKFLANVSHDLKTPIWGTNFFLGMLEKTQLTPEQLDFVQTIKDTNNHIFHLVEDLLDLSRIEAGQMNIVKEPFNIYESIEQLHSILHPKAKNKNLEFKLKIEENLPKTLIGDKIRINQILINLIDNSIKFTDKGFVGLTITQEQITKENVNLVFKVEDTGSGFETNDKSEVYQSFKKMHDSKKIEGLGLGLSIVAKLVELKNGKIDYQSEKGKGTIFTIEIPFTLA